MTDIYPLSIYLGKGYLCQGGLSVILETLPHSSLAQVSGQAASPAAPETDTGERVHSSCRINLETTFKDFI